MIKDVVLDILDYLRYQAANGGCTEEEMQSIYESTLKNIQVDATIKDIAKHYGQSESNVRNAVARSYVGKPKRRVYYNLIEFVKHIPKSWKRNT